MRDTLAPLLFLACALALALTLGLPGLEALRQADREAPRSARAVEQGRAIYVTRCAPCHGRLAEGTERGPALIAWRYGAEPLGAVSASRIHPDRRAIRGQGGWPAGTALPPPTLSAASREAVAAFLRELGPVDPP